MKNVAPLMLAATLTLSSFTTTTITDNLRPAADTARELIVALRQSSEDKFILLFPTLKDLHHQMDLNAALYGSNLEAAKEDLAKTYEQESLPAARRAYAMLIEEGEKRGIKWLEAKIVDIRTDDGVRISFAYQDQKMDVLIEKSLIINGHLKISQHLQIF